MLACVFSSLHPLSCSPSFIRSVSIRRLYCLLVRVRLCDAVSMGAHIRTVPQCQFAVAITHTHTHTDSGFSSHSCRDCEYGPIMKRRSAIPEPTIHIARRARDELICFSPSRQRVRGEKQSHASCSAICIDVCVCCWFGYDRVFVCSAHHDDVMNDRNVMFAV